MRSGLPIKSTLQDSPSAYCVYSKLTALLVRSVLMPLMQENVALNELTAHVTAAVLDWGEPIPEGIPVRPDFVLMADCVYSEPAFLLLSSSLSSSLMASFDADNEHRTSSHP